MCIEPFFGHTNTSISNLTSTAFDFDISNMMFIDPPFGQRGYTGQGPSSRQITDLQSDETLLTESEKLEQTRIYKVLEKHGNGTPRDKTYQQEYLSQNLTEKKGIFSVVTGQGSLQGISPSDMKYLRGLKDGYIKLGVDDPTFVMEYVLIEHQNLLIEYHKKQVIC